MIQMMYLLKKFAIEILCLPQNVEYKIVIVYIEMNFGNI